MRASRISMGRIAIPWTLRQAESLHFLRDCRAWRKAPACREESISSQILMDFSVFVMFLHCTCYGKDAMLLHQKTTSVTVHLLIQNLQPKRIATANIMPSFLRKLGLHLFCSYNTSLSASPFHSKTSTLFLPLHGASIEPNYSTNHRLMERQLPKDLRAR